MKKLFFILIFFSIFVVSEVKSQAMNSCANIIPHPTIEFTTSYGKLTYDNSKSQAELTILGSNHGNLEKGLFASGLAMLDVNWEVGINSVSRVLGENKICVIPAKINIFIGYQNPIIYLSDNLQVGTCEYNVVLRHEQTHQQINAAALDYFLPRLQSHAIRLAKQIKPIEISSKFNVDKATDTLTNNYSKTLEPIINEFKQALLTEQGKLDNHSNYKLEGDLCKYVNHKKF